MNRISNLFQTFRSIALSLVALLRWLSEDKTTEQLASVFATATKVATRVVRFYADNAATAQKAAKIVCKAADELATVAPEFAKNCESYVDDLEALTKKVKPVKADRPKRKYTRRTPTVTVTTITKPAPRSANPASPNCTAADCRLCDKPCATPLNKAGIPGILGR